MSENLQKHLRGIFKILQNRFDYVNNSIQHSLTKGEENENEIRQLLIDFLPPKYGIGSGIIMDIEGNTSKQIDIIIYDRDTPNYTLSSDSKIYLLDQVLAFIEIKTTFSTGEKGSLSSALENIKSVSILKPCQKPWAQWHNSVENEVQSCSLTQFKPSNPIGIIFFYGIPERKTPIELDIFFEGLKIKIEEYDKEHQPHLLFSLGHCSQFYHPELTKTEEVLYHSYLLHLDDIVDKPMALSRMDDSILGIANFGVYSFNSTENVSTKEILNLKNSKKILAIEGQDLFFDPILYRTCKIKGEYYFLDQYRGFYNFIVAIDRLLRVKHSNKNHWTSDYFPDGFFGMSRYESE
jgi:hypothetical protein